MGDNEIQDMALAAGMSTYEDFSAAVRFATAVRAAAMEEAAMIADNTTEVGAPDMGCETKAYASGAAIRAAARG